MASPQLPFPTNLQEEVAQQQRAAAAPTPDFLSQWQGVDRELPANAPDAYRDELRRKFFQANVLPWAMSKGHASTAVEEEFMRKTERESKAEFPRAELFGKSALQGAAEPLLGLIKQRPEIAELRKRLADSVRDSVAEAAKQGISPTPYAMAGQMAGAGVYAGPAMAAGRAIAALAELPAAAPALEGAVFGGAYEAAKADDGHRMEEGLKGAVGGGVIGSLFGLLHARLPASMADAVEATAKGTATPAEEKLAATALKVAPDVAPAVEQQVKQTVAANKRVGKPATPPAVGRDPLKVVVGNAQQQVPVTIADMLANQQERLKLIQQLRQPIKDALDKGAEVQSVEGPPKEVREVFHQLDQANLEAGEYSVPLAVKGGDVPSVTLDAKDIAAPPRLEGRATGPAPPETAPLLKAEEPTPPSSATTPAKGWRVVDLTPAQAQQFERVSEGPEGVPIYRETKTTKAGATIKIGQPFAKLEVDGKPVTISAASEQRVGELVASKIASLRKVQLGMDEAPTSDFVQKLPGGLFRDGRTGRVYRDYNDIPKQMRYALEDPTGKKKLEDLVGKKIADDLNDLAEEWDKEGPGPETPEDQWYFNKPEYNTPEAIAKRAEQDKEVQRVLEIMRKREEERNSNISRQATTLAGTPIPQFRYPRGQEPQAWWKKPGEAGMLEAPPMEAARERGLYTSYELGGDLAQQGFAGAAEAQGPGQKPNLYFNRAMEEDFPEQGRQIPYHEGLHGHFAYFGWHEPDAPWLDRVLASTGELAQRVTGSAEARVDSMFHDLTHFMKPELRSWYEKNGALPEETYVYLSQAIRHQDAQLLDRFIKADKDEASVLDWHAEKTRDLMELTSMQAESVHKSVAMRRMTDLLVRSTNRLEDLSRQPAALGAEVRVEGGRYIVEDPLGQQATFDSREALADHLAQEYSAPLSQGNLIDESSLPKSQLRMAVQEPFSDRKAPIQTNPPDPSLMVGARKPIIPGMMLASWYVRPFMAWLDTAARKFEMPEVYGLFKRVQEGKLEAANYSRPFAEALTTFAREVGLKRQQELYTYLKAEKFDREFTARELHVTDAEKASLEKLQAALAPMESRSGHSLETYIRDIAPKLQNAMTIDPNAMRPQASFVSEKFPEWSALVDAVGNGELDPRDQNLFRVASEYIRLSARKEFVEPHLTAAAKVVNAVDAKGNMMMGELQPLLARVLNSERGVPDFTQRIISNAMQSAMDLYNKGIEVANTSLPEGRKLPTLDALPRDAMRKWIQYSYAGGLMLRPMVLIRDALQVLTNTLPVLGPKYIARGMERAWPAMREGAESDAFRIAQESGALIGRDELMRFQAAEEGGQINRGVSQAMNAQTWAHNGSRLISFWGHYERIVDALQRGVDESFADRSAISFLDPLLRDRFMREAGQLAPREVDAFARRAAKELVDTTQWNYDRLGSPGFHKYALGRLFGQYGTFPLNYIEYARRLATRGSPQFRMENLARLAAAHLAVLQAGQATGVDTARWIFTQPMAYGGGPLFTAAIHIPGSLDFESQRGAEARRDVIRPLWPMSVPGGLAAEQVYKAVTTDDPDLWKIMLGFTPMKAGEENKGYHQIFGFEGR